MHWQNARLKHLHSNPNRSIVLFVQLGQVQYGVCFTDFLQWLLGWMWQEEENSFQAMRLTDALQFATDSTFKWSECIENSCKNCCLTAGAIESCYRVLQPPVHNTDTAQWDYWLLVGSQAASCCWTCIIYDQV